MSDVDLNAVSATPGTLDEQPAGGLKRPDITPAQIISGIPILAELLHAFGLYDLSVAQQESLGKVATWAFALLGADALIRVGRSLGIGKSQVAPHLEVPDSELEAIADAEVERQIATGQTGTTLADDEDTVQPVTPPGISGQS